VGNYSAPWVWSVRITEVVRPAEMIAIADSKADANWDSAIDPETWQDAENPSKRHNGGAQVLYCDSHVTHGRTDKLIEPVDWARRQWNKDFLPHRELWQDEDIPPG
jgi:prepilin-type processing-associated H-X9-DG protein